MDGVLRLYIRNKVAREERGNERQEGRGRIDNEKSEKRGGGRRRARKKRRGKQKSHTGAIQS